MLTLVNNVTLMASPKKSLTNYRTRRAFASTPEPTGRAATPAKTVAPQKSAAPTKAARPIFVIQKHAASHLHYDLRLEVGGVLKSWAVPKGVPTAPTEKHLAIATDDHPREYATFEGTIPPGNYGAGTVAIWDTGTYKNLKNKTMAQCIKDGRIEVEFNGKKVTGGYALVKTKLQKGEGWLFIKMRDDR